MYVNFQVSKSYDIPYLEKNSDDIEPSLKESKLRNQLINLMKVFWIIMMLLGKVIIFIKISIILAAMTYNQVQSFRINYLADQSFSHVNNI